MQFQIFNPPTPLRNHVQYFWSVSLAESSSQAYETRTLVDDSSGIIFQHHQGNSAVMKDGVYIPKAFIYGQTTQPTVNTCVPGFSGVGVLFHPDAISDLFRVNSFELTDSMVPLTDFIGATSLSAQILNSNDVYQQINILSDFLTDRLKTKINSATLASNVISLINSRQGVISVRTLREYFRISERQLERIFANHVGVTPSHFIQVARFKEVMKRIRSGNYQRMIDIAMDLEYTDQPHFNNTVKKLSGYTPSKLKRYLSDNVVNLLLTDDVESVKSFA